MREIIDFCNIGKSLGYDNRLYCNELNDKIGNQEAQIIINDFLLNTHPREVKLSINIDNKTILRLNFNYLRQFYGYPDKWENAIVKIFHQTEIIVYQSVSYREIPMSFFVLYDEKNNFTIKSSNLYVVSENGKVSNNWQRKSYFHSL